MPVRPSATTNVRPPQDTIPCVRQSGRGWTSAGVRFLLRAETLNGPGQSILFTFFSGGEAK